MPKMSGDRLVVITIKGGQRPGPLKPSTHARIARGVAAMEQKLKKHPSVMLVGEAETPVR